MYYLSFSLYWYINKLLSNNYFFEINIYIIKNEIHFILFLQTHKIILTHDKNDGYKAC